MEKNKIRTFSGGATRDQDETKLDFEGFLSPLVLKRFAEYMHKNRKQSDGKLRASDNWQKGFGDEHLNVCLKSKIRHDLDLWLWHRGYKKQARTDAEDSCCAIIFNTMAYLKKILEDKNEKNLS